MKTPTLLLAIGFIIFSCSENDPILQDSSIKDLGNLQVFEPEDAVPISNPFSRPTIVATIDGASIIRSHPKSTDTGLLHIIRTPHQLDDQLSFHLNRLETGAYILGDSSGFTRAFYNDIPCSEGILKVLSYEEGKLFASFEFVAGDHIVEDGFIYDAFVEETYDKGQNHEISARINGERWEAEVFGADLLAASFVVRGYNQIGNVRMDIHTSSFNEPGFYDLMDNDGFNGVSFTVAKEQVQLKSGAIHIVSAGNGEGVIGLFSAEFEGYSIKKGRFHLMK